MKQDIALVYMVAGISSRYGGKIKQFAKVSQDETLIEYSLKQAIQAGFTKIIFIVGNKTEYPFKEIFGNNFKGIPVFYALQKYDPELRDKPLGTVDALCSAKSFLDCPFVVCNGDDIYGENTFKILVEHLKNSKEEATIGYKLIDVIPENGGTNKGIFKINKDNYVQKINEVFNIIKSDLALNEVKAEDLCSLNIFALHPETISYLDYQLELFKKNYEGDRKAECLLPLELSKLIERNKIKMKAYTTKDKWLGITNLGDEEIVKQKLLL